MIGKIIREPDLDASDLAQAPGIEGFRKSQALEREHWWLIEVFSEEAPQRACTPFQVAPLADLIWKSPDVDRGDDSGRKIYHVVAIVFGGLVLSGLA